MKKNQEPELNALGQTFGEALESQFENEKSVSIIEKLNANNLPELIGWKEKQETLLKENPYVEITDPKTYDLACKSRTNLLKGRTELEKQDKAIASKVAAFRKEVAGKTQELIEITLTAEQTQQTEVKRWEGIKEAERAERERLENERIDAIKNRASEMESSALSVIQKMNYDGIISDSAKVSEIMETNFDFEEFDILYTNAFSRVQSALEEKVKDLTQRETERLETIRLQEENAEAKRKSDLQASRLQEILPYVAFGSPIDLTKLSEMDNDEYQGNLSSKKGLFEANKEMEELKSKRAEKLISSGFSFDGNNYFVGDFKRLDIGTILRLSDSDFDSIVKAGITELNRLKEIEESTKKAQEEKAKQEKDATFEIRKNRLSELGIEIDTNGENFVVVKYPNLNVAVSEVYNYDFFEFEEHIKGAKSSIEFAIEKEKEIADQKEADEKASKADAAKLKAENKARIKRLASDKGLLIKSFSILKGAFVSEIITLKFENTESQELANEMIKSFDSIFDDYMSKIENL